MHLWFSHPKKEIWTYWLEKLGAEDEKLSAEDVPIMFLAASKTRIVAYDWSDVSHGSKTRFLPGSRDAVHTPIRDVTNQDF